MLTVATGLVVSSGAALVLAGRSARTMLRRTPATTRIGPWNLDLTRSSGNATMYQRARDARHTPYALPAPEAIYFASFSDSDAQPLRRECTYRIEGTDPDTRWWSLTAYCANQLIPNARKRYSFTKTTINRLPHGNWSVTFSHQEQPGNWLPGTNQDGALQLVLRCYGPSQELLANPAAAPLPRILKEVVP